MARWVGIDGCRAGWIITYLDENNQIKFDIVAKFNQIFQDNRKISRAFVDMPIGIPNGDNFPRQCDIIAKNLLKTRQSTIFLPPCREALNQPSYEKALLVHRQKIGKGFSIQAWNISKKIREIDNFLQKNPNFLSILYESHPELNFAGLNQGIPLLDSKHSIKGIQSRIKLIQNYCYQKKWKFNWSNIQSLFPAYKVKKDDHLDSIVLLIAAHQPKHNILSIPKIKIKDCLGIPMQITFINHTSP